MALSVGPYRDPPQPHAPKSGKFTPSQRGKDRANPYQVPICMKFNKEGCRSPSCSYRHICLSCHGQNADHSCGSSHKESAGGKLPFRKEASH